LRLDLEMGRVVLRLFAAAAAPDARRARHRPAPAPVRRVASDRVAAAVAEGLLQRASGLCDFNLDASSHTITILLAAP
jgi:hypothetical protein